MSSFEQTEELKVLQAIFCQSGEMQVIAGEASTSVSIKLECSFGDKNRDMVELRLNIVLSRDYPKQAPSVSIQCDRLSSPVLAEIENNVSEKSRELLGDAMLLDLITLTRELAEEQSSSSSGFFPLKEIVEKELEAKSPNPFEASSIKVNSQSFDRSQTRFSGCASIIKGDTKDLNKNKGVSIARSNPSLSSTSQTKDVRTLEVSVSGSTIRGQPRCSSRTVILCLDHMRSKSSYVKQIKQWTAELGLGGRLIFCHKSILLLLQGDGKAIKDYIVRNRTTKVDVDSKGRGCKERMLSVVSDTSSDSFKYLADFSVLEFDTPEQLADFFKELQMTSLYEEGVKCLVLKHVKDKKSG